MYRQHGSPSTIAAILVKIGLIISHDSLEPPGIIDGPFSAPSSPPETPQPTKCRPRPSRSLQRRCVSVKSELPPSMITSPFSVSYTHLRAHETPEHLVCRLLLEKK